MLTIDKLNEAGSRQEQAHADLAAALAVAAETKEAAIAARLALAEEEARILRDHDPETLGKNEAARKAAIVELTADVRRAAALAEQGEREAAAQVEIAKAHVASAKGGITVLGLMAQVLGLTTPAPATAPRRQAPAVPPQPALAWPAGTAVVVTDLAGANRQGTILELLLDEAMYLIGFEGGAQEKVHPSWVAEAPRGGLLVTAQAPSAEEPTPTDPGAPITDGQFMLLGDLLGRAFATKAAERKWLWNQHQLVESSIRIKVDQALFGQLREQLQDLIAKRKEQAEKRAAKAQAPAAEEAGPAEPPAAPEAKPVAEPAPTEPAAPAEDVDDFADFDAA